MELPSWRGLLFSLLVFGVLFIHVDEYPTVPFYPAYIFLTHQERAQENERNKIEVCKLIATFIAFNICFLITGLSTKTGEHDLMPSFTCGTPGKGRRKKEKTMNTRDPL